MRKIFIVATLVTVIFSNVCFALRASDFALGGLRLNTPYENVIARYGQPTNIPGGYSQLVSNVIMYGGNIEIGFLGKKIRYIVTTADNGWQTPAGVRVNMPLDEVIDIYGDDYEVTERTFADIPKFMRESDKPYFEYNWTGTQYSWTRVSDSYVYKPGDTKYIISVIVDEDETVTAVKLSQRTPEN